MSNDNRNRGTDTPQEKKPNNRGEVAGVAAVDEAAFEKKGDDAPRINNAPNRHAAKAAVGFDSVREDKTTIAQGGRVDSITTAMMTYVEKLKSAKNPEQKADAQVLFFNTMKTALDAENQQEFRREWNTILNFVNKHADQINPMTMLQGSDMWAYGLEQHTAYRTLAFMAYMSRDPEDRFNRKDFDGAVVARVIGTISQEAVNRISSFYNI